MTTAYSLLPIRTEDLPRYRFREEEATFGSLSTAHGYLPLRSLALHGRFTGLAYNLRLRQTFSNQHNGALEATYIFPLPARAAVTQFVMRTRDREVVGELKDRGQARQIYDQAISQGFQAAIAEEERPEVFTIRVGNIPAGEDIEIELELSGPLAIADSMATFRFPLVVAPRYMPGCALLGGNVGDGTACDTDATPDASRISPPLLLPGYPNPVRLGIELELDSAGLDFDSIYTSLDQLYLEQGRNGNPVLLLSPQAGQLNQDLILRFPVLKHELQTSLSQVADEDDTTCTWALTVVPPQNSGTTIESRNLVVLLDRSGSMQGWKMAAARRAVGRIVDSFTDQDRFAILAFDTVVEEVATAAAGQVRNLLNQANDRNRFRAVQELGKVEARGGTELASAVMLGLERLHQSHSTGEKYLVLVTDGQVGNEDQVLREIERQAKGIRIFTIGIDRAINASLLQRVANFSGGHCELVESEDRLDEVMLQLQRRLCQPFLTDICVDSQSTQLTPTTVDLFPGLPARLYGRSLQPLPDTVLVSGRDRGGAIWKQRVPVHSTADLTLRSLWARERILEMEHGFVTGKQGVECSPAHITQFSLAYGVLSRFTSFVAVDRSRRVSQQGPQHKVVQAVDIPAGWNQGAGNVSQALPFASMAPSGFTAAENTFGCSFDAFAAPAQDPFCEAMPAQDPFSSAPLPTPPGGLTRLSRPQSNVAREVSTESTWAQNLPASPAPPPLRSAPIPAPAPQTSAGKMLRRSVAPRPKMEAGPPQGGARDLLARLKQLVAQAGRQQAQLIEALEALLDALSRKGVPTALLQKGYKILDHFRVKHPGADARLQAWIQEVEQTQQQPAPEGALDREGWWKS